MPGRRLAAVAAFVGLIAVAASSAVGLPATARKLAVAPAAVLVVGAVGWFVVATRRPELGAQGAGVP